MGASSVTGVSGIGSAEGKIRGPGNGRNMYDALIDPRVVWAGNATIVEHGGTDYARVFVGGILAGAASDFVIVAAAEHAVTVVKHETAGALDYFDIQGTTADVADFIVVVK